MSIAERRRLAGSVQPIGINQRMPGGLDDFDVLESYRTHLRGKEFGRPLDVGLMLRQRADAGYAQEILKLGEETRLILTRVIESRRGHHEEYTEPAAVVAGAAAWFAAALRA